MPFYQKLKGTFSEHAAVKVGGGGGAKKDVKQFRCPDVTTFKIKHNGRLYYLNRISSFKNTACFLNEWHKIMVNCSYGDLRKLESDVEDMKVTNLVY